MASGECPKQWRLPPQLVGIRLVVSEEFDPRRTMRVPPASRRLPRLERGVCRMETHDIRSRGYSPRVRMLRPANLFTSPLTNQSEGETALRHEDDRARNRRCDFCSASLKEGGCEREHAAPRYIQRTALVLPACEFDCRYTYTLHDDEGEAAVLALLRLGCGGDVTRKGNYVLKRNKKKIRLRNRAFIRLLCLAKQESFYFAIEECKTINGFVIV